ncbi:MAG: hypothetical protein CMM42_17635 [Rhodospirillaceae bacterium]|nr:hypothetical protein [Rhodospirillaceae bacterium]
MKLRKMLVRAAILGGASALAAWVSRAVVPGEADPFAPTGEAKTQVIRAGLAGAVFGLVSGII